MKSVCIVGAGPAGLVTAKTFLDTEQFDVTIYEKHDRIGGIWALDEDTQDAFLSPFTPTNLSKFTVGFSDLDWNEIDARSKSSTSSVNGAKKPRVPLYPKAHHVNRYLEEYTRRYLTDAKICLSTKVISASRTCKYGSDSACWSIKTESHTGHHGQETFEHFVLASGFFSRPRSIGHDLPDASGKNEKDYSKIIHSSRFRVLADLFPRGPAQDTNILIIGGGNSAGETAAAVAMQLSNARWSPNKGQTQRYQGCKVIHVTPRPMYAIPPFVEYEEGSRSYVPVDLKLYDYSKRPQGMESYGGQQVPQVRDIVHKSIQTMVGGDQADLGSNALVSNGEGADRGTAYVALTETYSEFVRSGLIEVNAGRVLDLNYLDSLHSAVIAHDGQQSTVENISAVIYATGYDPTSAIDFLDDDVKTALDFDSTSMRLPVLLEQWQTVNRRVPDLAFVGMYEGPYWPMMEIQGRLTASRWLGETAYAEQRPFETVSRLEEMRLSMQRKGLDVGQFWFNDYLGYCEDIADHLGLSRLHGKFGPKQGCTSPARFKTANTQVSQAQAILDDLHETWFACIDKGRYVPRAVLRALHGEWNISRRIESTDLAYSGTLQGSANFHPRFPTADKSDKVFDLEYLYIESGTFTNASRLEMKASRRYVYRYAEQDDTLSIWFVKPDNDLEVDYLFHNLAFVSPVDARKAGTCVAKADHLCVEDMYWTKYTLPMEAIVLRKFEIEHVVKGPHKDYTSTTRYTRPAKRPR
ncbi:hypothetical protein LTR78_009762 [Recurvomyces mirabilis]|uniref:FHA domain-containing protein n=1 Tax=Recurvomyces mirabilis TaxID=574656 RepID=A0AAE0TRQ6_9PEZI|nr:hypothetical protein LTR78_009762 [Recurvomyces mirabilis]KAK5158180.1 hypothetical protein LTS14_003198 [Recurvomyces mirabilis]